MNAGATELSRTPVGSVIQGQRLHQVHDQGLGGVVDRLAPVAAKARDRTDDDDVATGLLQLGQHGLGQRDECVDVDRADARPLLGRDLGERFADELGGVVDEHVQPTEAIESLGDHVCGRLRLGQVGTDGQRLGLVVALEGLGQLVDPSTDDRHRGTVVEEGPRDGLTDAAARAGDQHDLVLEVVPVRCRHEPRQPADGRRHSLSPRVVPDLEPIVSSPSGEFVSTRSVLFIGGTGIISSACTQRAVDQGWQVSVLNRGRSETRPSAPEVEQLSADIADLDAVGTALGGREFDVVADFRAFTPTRCRLGSICWADGWGSTCSSAPPRPIRRRPRDCRCWNRRRCATRTGSTRGTRSPARIC